MKIDWNKIKLSFLSGKSREDICKEFELKYETLSSKIKKGKWIEQKAEIAQKTNQKIIEKTSDKIAEEQAKLISIQKAYSKSGIGKAGELLNTPLTANEYCSVMSGLERAIRLARQAVGLKDSIEIDYNLKSQESYRLELVALVDSCRKIDSKN